MRCLRLKAASAGERFEVNPKEKNNMKRQLGHDEVIEHVHSQNDILITDALQRQFELPFKIDQVLNGHQLYALTVHSDGTKEPDDTPWEDELVSQGFTAGDKVFVTLTDHEGQKLTDNYELELI
jgi:hypothetical protein